MDNTTKFTRRWRARLTRACHAWFKFKKCTQMTHSIISWACPLPPWWRARYHVLFSPKEWKHGRPSFGDYNYNSVNGKWSPTETRRKEPDNERRAEGIAILWQMNRNRESGRKKRRGKNAFWQRSQKKTWQFGEIGNGNIMKTIFCHLDQTGWKTGKSSKSRQIESVWRKNVREDVTTSQCRRGRQ